jgi:23S rRNA (adenine2030-N6)-methyltransferase
MNYRHAYHAGNHGDVLKHAVLARLVAFLHEKPAPVFILDTHAGIGAYDLTAVEAGKTEEWRAGIGRLFDTPSPELEPYLTLVRNLNPDGGPRHYPGSPAVVAELLRPGDRLVLAELHPVDAEALRRWARGRQGVTVHHRDGYEAIGAFLPPREGRGLVLVDPPYEAPEEYDRLAASLIAGCRRWPGGRWLAWVPIKDRAPVWRLEEALLTAGIGQVLTAELLMRPVDGVSLAGSTVVLINPPYGFEHWLSGALAELQAILAPQHGSHAWHRLGSPSHG